MYPKESFGIASIESFSTQSLLQTVSSGDAGRAAFWLVSGPRYFAVAGFLATLGIEAAAVEGVVFAFTPTFVADAEEDAELLVWWSWGSAVAGVVWVSPENFRRNRNATGKRGIFEGLFAC